MGAGVVAVILGTASYLIFATPAWWAAVAGYLGAFVAHRLVRDR